MAKYPKVEFAEHKPLTNWYNDGEGKLYCVSRLIESTKHLPVFDAPLVCFDLGQKIWEGCNMFDLAFHIQAVNNADLDYPIILDWNGNIADGRHRLLKAISLGHTTIKCIRMDFKPHHDKLVD